MPFKNLEALLDQTLTEHRRLLAERRLLVKQHEAIWEASRAYLRSDGETNDPGQAAGAPTPDEPFPTVDPIGFRWDSP